MRIGLTICTVLLLSALITAQVPDNSVGGVQTTPPAATAGTDSSSPSSSPGVSSVAQPLTQPIADNSHAGLVETVVLPQESSKDLAEAKREFAAGVKLKDSGKLEAALDRFEQAAKLNPRSVDYVTAREVTRQELVMAALDRGNRAMLQQKEVVAMAEFRRALEYDPNNDFARQRLGESMAGDIQAANPALRVAEKSEEIVLQPAAAAHDFHYRGDAKTLLTQIAKAYGVSALFDDSVPPRRVRFDIEEANFATAMEAATRVTKTFWITLSANQMYFLTDTIENRRNFERMSIRTFYLSDLVTPQELVEVVNILRVVLDLRFVVQDNAESTITIRAPQTLLDAAAQLLGNMVAARPEVVLDINAFEISHSFLRQLGTALPTQFTLFNISPQLIAGLGAGAQNLINQLIASGGINQANSQAIQALLAQLQQSTQNPILQNPFATFGGGLTLMGLSAGGTGATVNFNLNTSDVRILEHVTLRTTQNSAATMKIGERYPIVNATFAPIYNSGAIASVLSNQSYIAPFPSFNFEDLGLTLKATPVIHADKDVTLKVELQFRSLGASTVNGIPIINNREYSGTITAKDGESSVVAGMISTADSRNLMGYPFLSRVPGLTYGFSEHDKNLNDDEVLIVISPRIMRRPSQEAIAISLPSGH